MNSNKVAGWPHEANVDLHWLRGAYGRYVLLGALNKRGCSLLDLIGLDEYAERVYRTVLAHQGLSLDELAPRADLDPTRLRAALDRLEAEGLVRQSGNAYHAPDPEIALRALLIGRLAGLLRDRQALDEAADLVAEFVVVHRLGVERAGGFEDVEFVPADAEREHLDRAVRAATGEVVSVHKGPFTPQSGREEPDAGLDGHGVTFRAIYAPEWLHVPGAMDRARGYASLGRQIRTLRHMPTNLTVVDGQQAFLPRELLEPGHSGMIELRSAPVVASLLKLFEVLWDRALPFTSDLPTAAADKGELTPDLLPLIPLLAAGMQDGAIARQLGIGLRTVRRRMQHLMELTGSRTRLQLGIALARRGWV